MDSNYKIESLKQSDVKQLAKVYQAIFKDNFSSHLGQKFIRLFCEQFVNSNYNFGFIVKDEKLPVAFILGTTAPEKLYRKFYRDHLVTLSLLFVQKFIQDKYVRKNISNKFNHLGRALKALLIPNKVAKQAVQIADTGIPARILALGVLPEYRRRGLANELTAAYCEKARSKGFKKVELSTNPDNTNAIRFYQKDGWNIDHENDSAVSFSRCLHTP